MIAVDWHIMLCERVPPISDYGLGRAGAGMCSMYLACGT